jgi:hypothetical protein
VDAGGFTTFLEKNPTPFIALGGNHVEPYLKQEAKQLLARFDNDPAKAAEALLISVVTQAAGYARQ